jgi:hypothetical protein
MRAIHMSKSVNTAAYVLRIHERQRASIEAMLPQDGNAMILRGQLHHGKLDIIQPSK